MFRLQRIFFGPSMSEICFKAKKIIALIYRQYYQHSNTDASKQLYISSVRPHLEYAAAVWNPHLPSGSMCTKYWIANYGSLLTTCNLPSLKKRHLFLKLSFFLFYQLVNDLVIFPSHSASHCEARLNTRSANLVQLVRRFSMTDS